MYTANTMSSSFEALGISLLGSSQMASPDGEKADSAAESARVLVEAVKRDLEAARHHHAEVDRERDRPGDGDGRVHQRGAPLSRHRLAAEVPWTIDDFERIRKRVPVLCNLKPSGDYVAVDLHRAGGVPQVLKMLLTHGVLHGDCMTITGRTIGEELETGSLGATRRSGRHPAVVEPDVCGGPSRHSSR
jgi:dihydroxy-acid dehydratase